MHHKRNRPNTRARVSVGVSVCARTCEIFISSSHSAVKKIRFFFWHVENGPMEIRSVHLFRVFVFILCVSNFTLHHDYNI